MTSAARLARRMAAGVVLLGWLAVAATVLASGSELWWLLELFVHFRPWYALLLLLSAACALWLRRRGVAAIVCGAALVNVASIAPAHRHLFERAAAAPQLQVVVFNAGVHNTRLDAVVDFLATARADAVVVLEVGSRWRQPLAALEPVYPHQLMLLREDPFGLALLSAHPCAPCELVERDGQPPALLGRLALPQLQVWIAGVHAPPPLGADSTRARDDYLLKMGQRLAGLDGPRLLAGDFNTTPWARGYRTLLHMSKLSDGGFARATWPAFLPFPLIPIDHVLASQELQVVAKRRGPVLGSDHYPIVVALRMRGRSEAHTAQQPGRAETSWR